MDVRQKLFAKSQTTNTETAAAAAAAAMAVEEENQVRRHSFHFDGSRYFSWLPSLHVELSDVIREVFAAGADQFNQVVDDLTPRPPPTNLVAMQTDAITRAGDYTSEGSRATAFDPEHYELIRLPTRLRQPAREIARMFPQFPLGTIVADLLRTGVPEVTVENLISRPPPVRSLSPSPSLAQSTTVVRSRLSNTGTNVRSLFGGANVDQNSGGTSTAEATDSVPAVSFASSTHTNTEELDGSGPETILARRRRFMLDQARERFFSRNPPP
ncbi:unnamed protein product [Echinostoma caproni]|uniref:CUE domain-containing protein n=1 Tax=Echinostoma caproni TaxID=27848 RepID=A0A183AH24_9TREM|nr:unnamed protein product [Echinostoma caproni]